jgi:hypothetical protein
MIDRDKHYSTLGGINGLDFPPLTTLLGKKGVAWYSQYGRFVLGCEPCSRFQQRNPIFIKSDRLHPRRYMCLVGIGF